MGLGSASFALPLLGLDQPVAGVGSWVKFQVSVGKVEN
jgi:hypothetical protein